MTDPRGFSVKATRFFEDLEDDNSREFWAANKNTFETAVKKPMAALLDSLPDRYQPFKVYRMNRDVRFSADKSPYKPDARRLEAWLRSPCGTSTSAPARGCCCGRRLPDVTGPAGPLPPGGGRRHLGPPRLEKIIAKLERAGIEVEHGGPEPLKTAPARLPERPSAGWVGCDRRA